MDAQIQGAMADAITEAKWVAGRARPCVFGDRYIVMGQDIRDLRGALARLQGIKQAAKDEQRIREIARQECLGVTR